MLSLSSCMTVSSLVSQKTCNQDQLGKPANVASPVEVHSAGEVFISSTLSVRLLNSCAAERKLKLGHGIHAGVLKAGLASNVFVANSLVDFYSKCGLLGDAFKVFDTMLVRTVVSYTSMMSGCCQNGFADIAVSIFQQMLLECIEFNEFTFAVLLQACGQSHNLKLAETIHGRLIVNEWIKHQFLQYSIVNAYSKCGASLPAEKLMEKSCCRDVVSWTMAISGCVLNGLSERALILFSKMLADEVAPNRVTFLSLIQACSLLNRWLISTCIHGFAIKSQLYMDALVTNSLIQMYASNGYHEESIKIFREFFFRGHGHYLRPETMAILLQGCGHSNCLKHGKEAHGHLIRHSFLPCIVVENSLMDMYAENGRADLASRIFLEMNEKDIVSWNTMISCFVKNGRPLEALMLVGEVHRKGDDAIVPDFITVLTALQACSALASLDLGEVIHGYIFRSGFMNDIFIGNSLINMYGKSGRIEFAQRVFQEMPAKDTGSWNAMIAAYGINGDGISALETLGRMINSDTQPNAVTFVNVLSGCSHSGLVEEAYECFNNMGEKYRVEPSMEHYACMVDLLGRQGRLDEAEDFIKKMPFRPGQAVWGALLGSCGLSSNVDAAEKAASNLSILDPDGKVWRVTMSNVYARVNRWEDAAKLRTEMKRVMGLKKDAGWSSVEVRGESYTFIAGDTTHPESEKIYRVLRGIREHIQTFI